MKIPIRKAMLASLRIMSPAIGPSGFSAIQTGLPELPFPSLGPLLIQVGAIPAEPANMINLHWYGSPSGVVTW